jgi:hypothetical protein
VRLAGCIVALLLGVQFRRVGGAGVGVDCARNLGDVFLECIEMCRGGEVCGGTGGKGGAHWKEPVIGLWEKEAGHFLQGHLGLHSVDCRCGWVHGSVEVFSWSVFETTAFRSSRVQDAVNLMKDASFVISGGGGFKSTNFWIFGQANGIFQLCFVQMKDFYSEEFALTSN